MDPLSAFSLAGTIVQFVDFGTKVVSQTRQLYKNGQLSVHAQAKSATEDLLDFSAKLQQYHHWDSHDVRPTEDDKALAALCRSCDEIAKTLLEQLIKLQVPGDGRKQPWKTVGQALRSIWAHEQLADLEERLASYRRAMDSRILGSLSKKVDLIQIQQSHRFDNLDETTQKIVAGLADIRRTVDGDLNSRIQALTQLLDRGEVVIIPDAKTTQRAVFDLKQADHYASSFKDKELCKSVRKNELMMRKSVAKDVLKSLYYPTIKERFEEVAEAHQKTFNWIFQDPKANTTYSQWSNFVEWLQNDEGLYWISGKAGSGKSTLMKYIYSDTRMRSIATSWAATSTLCIAGFFFWSSGTKEQRSQSGLLRSLLYDTLSQFPSLIPIVLPEQWASCYSAKCSLTELPQLQYWPPSLLEQAFRQLTLQTIVPMRFCFFIDGLDEYEGNDLDMADLFGDVAKMPHVKVCVSSRPHVAFKVAFSDRPKLRLHDLTFRDIQQYVKDRLVNNVRWRRLERQEPIESPNLILDIVTSANGVFLWVKLVVTSLLNGLGNQDRLIHLQKRVRALPQDLDKLYEHIVLGVDPIYQEDASRLFQIIAGTQQRTDDYGTPLQLSILGLALAAEENPDLAQKAQINFLTECEVLELCKEMDIRLASQCGGLLETQFGDSEVMSPELKVTYLHRTVKDFLDRSDTRTTIVRWTGGRSSFNADLAIFKSHVLQPKARSPFPTSTAMRCGGEIEREELYEKSLNISKPLVQSLFTYALRVESSGNGPQLELLEQFEEAIQFRWSESGCKSRGSPYPMLIEAVQSGCHHYLSQKLALDTTIPRRLFFGSDLLEYALNPTPENSQFVSPTIVKILLEHGADPNRRVNELDHHEVQRGLDRHSPWIAALSCLQKHKIPPPTLKKEAEVDEFMATWADALKLFSRHGVHKNTTSLGWDIEQVIRDVFGDYPQLQCELLSVFNLRLEEYASKLHNKALPIVPQTQNSHKNWMRSSQYPPLQAQRDCSRQCGFNCCSPQ